MKESTPKDNAIRWMNSLTNAANIIANLHIDDLNAVTTEIQKLANWFYDVEPSLNELEENILHAKTIDELDSLKEAVVKTDSVKMFNLWNEIKIKLWA